MTVGTTVSNSFTLTVGPSSPSYIGGLSAYQVRALTGSFTPTNGKETMVSVTPVAWANAGTSGLIAYCGGFKTTSGNKLYLAGGGHSGTYNNGLYVFDFTGTNAPTGWTVPAISSSPTVAISDNYIYSDGMPCALHTYDGQCMMSNGRLFHTGLFAHQQGGGQVADWEFNFTNNVSPTTGWRLLGVETQPSGFPVFTHGMALADPGASGKTLILSGVNYPGYYAFYRSLTDNFSAAKQGVTPNHFSYNNSYTGVCAYRPNANPNTGTVVFSGQDTLGSGSYSITVDWVNETLSNPVGHNFGYLTTSQGGGAIWYDAAGDKFWGFGTGQTTVLEINPATYAVTPHTISGSIDWGRGLPLMSRFAWMPQYRAFGFCTDYDKPVYVLRLP